LTISSACSGVISPFSIGAFARGVDVALGVNGLGQFLERFLHLGGVHLAAFGVFAPHFLYGLFNLVSLGALAGHLRAQRLFGFLLGV
jgi:hypothetical protein